MRNSSINSSPWMPKWKTLHWAPWCLVVWHQLRSMMFWGKVIKLTPWKIPPKKRIIIGNIIRRRRSWYLVNIIQRNSPLMKRRNHPNCKTSKRKYFYKRKNSNPLTPPKNYPLKAQYPHLTYSKAKNLSIDFN